MPCANCVYCVVCVQCVAYPIPYNQVYTTAATLGSVSLTSW